MVFFLCDGCNETLKKNKVDAHAAKCRECWSVSCVDCSQSFPGDEYRNHTSCISEAERYEKTIYRGTRKLDDSGTGHRQQQQHKGKKLTPQEAWQQTIEIAAESAPSSIKSHMDQLAGLDNVPRKEKQFRNFTVNSLRLRGPSAERIKDEIWKHLSKVREDEKQKKEEAQQKQQPAKVTKKEEKEAEEPTSISDDDKSSSNNAKEKESSSTTSMPSEKEVTKAVKKALKKAPNKSLKFKALRKSVQETLLIKTKSDSAKKEWKKLLKQCVDANSKKLVVDGKIVSLKD